MRAVVVVALAAVLSSGCGVLASLGIGGEEAEETPPRRSEIDELGGGRLLTLPRPTRGLVHLSLWIDAGSRDADPPQLATVAAWIAAGRAGERVRARVLPDGTVYEVMCEGDRLEECLAALGRALAAREPTPEEVTSARRRLVAARRRAAADEGRTADSLALSALLGESARGLSPLGRADGDDAIDGAAVGAFLERTHGPSRALLVASGDVAHDGVREAVEALFESSVPATGRREPRSLRVAEEREPAVEVGRADTVAVASAEPDLAKAAALAHAVVEATRGMDVPPVVHAFEVRGGALVIARGSAARADVLAQELVFAVHRARAEGLEPADIALEDDPVAAAHAAGMGWLAEGGDGGTTEGALGLGAVVRGGRGDVPSGEASDDPDDATRSAAAVRLERATRRARAMVRPSTRGTVGEQAASVVTDNGARIEVRRRRGDRRVAVAIRFAPGAAADPPSLHGRAAVLATLAAESCEGLGPGGLAARLGEMEATMVPAVDATSWGVVMEAPREHWAAALDLALRCALAPGLSRPDVERARIAVLDRLEGPAELAGWAAAAVAPEVPGAVAPLGELEPVRDLPVAAVRRMHADATVGARVAVSVVGDVPVDDAVARVARRVARMPAGTAAPRPVTADPVVVEGPVAVEHTGTTPRAVIAFRAPAPAPDPAAARAFAAAVAETLDGSRGLRRVWSDGGSHDGWVWAAIAVDATEAALADLPTRVERAVTSTPPEAVERWLELGLQGQARLAARPAVAGDRLARERLTGSPARPGPGATQAALRRASPRFAVGRPR